MNLKTTTMSEYKSIESKEIVWCNDNDRFIYIERTNGEISGINYMQGEELNYFKDHYCLPHKDLTLFYHAIHRYLRGNCELDRVNQAIWAHFEYKSSLDAAI